jgi:hypothetical protein
MVVVSWWISAGVLCLCLSLESSGKIHQVNTVLICLGFYRKETHSGLLNWSSQNFGDQRSEFKVFPEAALLGLQLDVIPVSSHSLSSVKLGPNFFFSYGQKIL